MGPKALLICLVGILCFSSTFAEEEDFSAVELSYAEVGSSDIEGATTEEIPVTSTKAYFPTHPELKASDNNSVPAAKGTEKNLGNLTIYESPNTNNSKLLLISIYDIFGFHPHVKYIADSLAASGFLVVIPDFFHGKPTPVDVDLKSIAPAELASKIASLFNKNNGSWATGVKSELKEVIRHYKKENGINAVGIYGFCWGGKMAVYAASDAEFTDLKAIGLVHPSKVITEDASNVKVPGILLPSNSEPDMIPFLDILNKNLGNKSEHHRYPNTTHGFAGAKSDFSSPAIRKIVEDVISRLSKFFTTSLHSSI